MDTQNPSPRNAAPGISIRNGPVERMDTDGPHTNGVSTNGATKRRARPSNGKSYNEDSSDGDGKPMVRLAEI